MKEVFAAGKAHGARRGDLFGCLYFYLTDQLRSFVEHLRKIDITFILLSTDIRDLAHDIKGLSVGHLSSFNSHFQGIVPKKFDRIEVSSTIDDIFVGYSPILRDWALRLNPLNPHSTLLAYSLNSAIGNAAAQPQYDRENYGEVMQKMEKENRVCTFPPSPDQMPHSIIVIALACA